MEIRIPLKNKWKQVAETLPDNKQYEFLKESLELHEKNPAYLLPLWLIGQAVLTIIYFLNYKYVAIILSIPLVATLIFLIYDFTLEAHRFKTKWYEKPKRDGLDELRRMVE